MTSVSGCFKVVALLVLAFAQGAAAQDAPPQLTPAGKAILEAAIAGDGRPLYDRFGPTRPTVFPLAMCTFPRGLCGAVRRDGSVAVPPRYDWVGTFSDGRAAMRAGGLYGFVDENGHEIVPPRYRLVGDYRFGFAQVDIDGKSGLIDRDGKLVIEPRYAFIRAIAPDRFRVADKRPLGEAIDAEFFPEESDSPQSDSSWVVGAPEGTGIIDRNSQWIEPPGTRIFDPDERTIRIVSTEILRPGPKQTLWGLQRSDGSWLVRPQFDRVNAFGDGLARVRKDGKTGFIDRDGQLVIPTVFDEAWAFAPGSARTAARQARSVGTIDRTGAWIFQMEARGIRPAISSDSGTPYGWHFERRERWGLLDLDGHVVLEAEFDHPIQRCADGHLVIVKDGQWLYFRSDGISLRPPNNGRILGSGCASPAPYVVKAGDKFGLMDGDGKEITPLEFDALVAAATGIWNAKRNGKWGRIGPDGYWLLEPKFDDLSRGNPIIVATTNTKRGFLKADGSWLIEPRFDAARLIDSETAFVAIEGATGIISLKDQSWVVAPRRAAMCEIPYAVLSQSDGHRAIFARNGRTWIDADVDLLGTDLEAGLLPFLKDGKWGLMDTAGEIAIPPIYDEQVSFRPTLRGIAWTRRDSRSCPIDRHGQDVPGMACIERSRSNESGGYFRCAIE
jgi:hypothetical protein